MPPRKLPPGHPFRISQASSDALEPIDTRTGEPMRPCDRCGSREFAQVIVARCPACDRPFARCPACGGAPNASRALAAHQHACPRKDA